MYYCGQTRPYGIRPNKTNFGLIFFWAFLARAICEGQERRREVVEEEEEEEEEKVWITMYL